MTITINGKTWFTPQELLKPALQKAVVTFRSYFIIDNALTEEIANEFFNYVDNLVETFSSFGIKLCYDINYDDFCAEQSKFPKIDSSNIAELVESAKKFVNVSIGQANTAQLSYDEIISIGNKANDSFYDKNDWLYTSGDYPKQYFITPPQKTPLRISDLGGDECGLVFR